MNSLTTSGQKFFRVFSVMAFTLACPAFSAENDGKCLSKLSNLRTELDQYHLSTQRWVNTWGVTWTAATVSQLVIATSIHGNGASETRKDLWAGSASSALGLIPTWFISPDATHEISLSGDCESELAQGEALAKDFALNSSVYNGPIAHVSNVAVNLATSLILGLGFGHWGAAAISFAAGVPLGEVMILTYPKSEFETSQSLPVLHAALTPSPSGPALALSLEFK